MHWGFWCVYHLYTWCARRVTAGRTHDGRVAHISAGRRCWFVLFHVSIIYFCRRRHGTVIKALFNIAAGARAALCNYCRDIKIEKANTASNQHHTGPNDIYKWWRENASERTNERCVCSSVQILAVQLPVQRCRTRPVSRSTPLALFV